ncbi:MAG TPA: hypothetical protein V6D14_11725 [Coleofasciculaceae cyanobacterium]|jgi:hypothetical protein
MSQLDLLKKSNSLQVITDLINRLFHPKDLSSSNKTTLDSLETRGEFVKGINFNGKAVTIDGYSWTSYSSALANGLSVPEAISITTSVKPQPSADRDTRNMLNSVVCKNHKLEIRQTLPNGTYNVYLWIIENYVSNHHSMDVSLGDETVAQGIGTLPFQSWAKYGPYLTTVTDSVLNLALTTTDPEKDAHIMGMAIFKSSSPE